MDYDKPTGSKIQVFRDKAMRTTGGLTKLDLMKNKRGKIVSTLKHEIGVSSGAKNLGEYLQSKHGPRVTKAPKAPKAPKEPQIPQFKKPTKAEMAEFFRVKPEDDQEVEDYYKEQENLKKKEPKVKRPMTQKEISDFYKAQEPSKEKFNRQFEEVFGKRK